MIYKDPTDGQPKPYRGNNPNAPEYFVNPISEKVRAYELSIITEILEKFEVDAIILDWLRFDKFNMDVSQETRDLFYNLHEIDPLERNLELDSSPDYPFLENLWNPFRTQFIADHVKSVRGEINRLRPNAKLGVYILSPYFTECGQDAALFKDDVDWVSPMAYWSFFGETADCLYRPGGIVSLAVDKMGDAAKVIPVLEKQGETAEYTAIMNGLRANFPGIQTISMFNYIKWEESDYNRLEYVAGLVDRPEGTQTPSCTASATLSYEQDTPSCTPSSTPSDGQDTPTGTPSDKQDTAAGTPSSTLSDKQDTPLSQKSAGLTIALIALGVVVGVVAIVLVVIWVRSRNRDAGPDDALNM
jgi:hypothetical protein